MSIHLILNDSYKNFSNICSILLTPAIVKERVGVSEIVNGSLHLVVTGIHVQLQLGVAVDLLDIDAACHSVTCRRNVTPQFVRVRNVGYSVIGETGTLCREKINCFLTYF